MADNTIAYHFKQWATPALSSGLIERLVDQVTRVLQKSYGQSPY